MVSYEDIQKASATIRTLDVKGKEYAIVNERIRAFRMVYPTGEIRTEILLIENGVVVMKATVCDENGKVLGTGTAYEKEGSSYINKTSYIENCETSAVGRALGMCGFGIDTAVCSAEEVKNAISQQEDNPLGVVCSVCGKPLTTETYEDNIGKRTYTVPQIVAACKKRKLEPMHLACMEELMKEKENVK